MLSLHSFIAISDNKLGKVSNINVALAGLGKGMVRLGRFRLVNLPFKVMKY